MERKIDIHKAAGILIKDKKLLITRSKGKSFFIAPGGKVESGETVTDALKRELNEELQIEIDVADLVQFGTFYAPSIGEEDTYLQMDVFVVSTWKGDIQPSHEIEEALWVDSNLDIAIELGSIFKNEVIPRLKDTGLID